MLQSIVHKELKEIFREGRFKLLAGIILLLLITTLLISYQQYKQMKAAHEAAAVAERHIWENQPEKNPHGAAHFGVYLFEPVYPLSFIEPGVQTYTGSTLYLEAHKRNSEQFSQVQDQTELSRFGNLTPSFVLAFLFPLLIILISFNVFSKERENGTLKILHSQGLPFWKLTVGKWLGVFVPVLLLLTPFFGLAFLLLVGMKDFSYLSFMLMIAGYLVLYAIIISISLFFSAIFKKAGMAFISCLLFWMATTILVPRLASNIAEKKYPVPTQEEMNKQIAEMNKSRGGNIHDLSGEMYKHLLDSLLKKYQVDSVAQLPINMAGIRLDVGEQLDTRTYDVVYEKVKQQFNRQKKLYNNASFASPFLAGNMLTMAVAQTDNKAHWHFTDAGETYRRLFVNKLNRHIAYESGQQETFTTFKATKQVWASIPAFKYNAPALSETLYGTGRQWASLLLWLCISFIALLVAVKKMDIQ